MTTYIDEVQTQKKFKGNVIILLKGEYFSIRQPDSGLVVPVNNNGSIISLTVNPSSVDLKKANTTINSYSFRINDKSLVVSRLLRNNSKLLIDEEVRIFLGRTGVSMDFADYFELPTVKIKKLSHADISFNFSAADSIDRMNKDFFSISTTLQANILNNTTVFQLGNVENFPDSGFGFLGEEFVSWTGRDTILNQLSGITRGEFGTTPTAHGFGTSFFNVDEVEENPITALLQFLTSTGTATNGPYDVLSDGLAIDQNLIDVAEMEQIRDDFFNLQTFNFKMYNTGNALRFFEDEILGATNTRFIVNENQKISLAVLDQAGFDEGSNNPIGENSITKFPKWDVNVRDIVSSIEIEYDYNDGTGKYEQKRTFQTELTETDTVIVEKPLRIKYKAIRENLGGNAIVEEIGKRYIARFETPTPEISIQSHIDKSLLNVGDKVLLTSSQIPNASGSLVFADTLEIMSRALNYITGDVTFKLQYTSYAGIRGAYIAPCTSIVGVQSQQAFEFPAGRASEYEIGWKVRLWDKTIEADYGGNNFVVGAYTGDGVRTIVAIDKINDIIFIDSPFTTILNDTDFAIRFANYDETNASQKRFAFVGESSGGDFPDGSSAYKIGL